jgi:hypothetical protein
VSACGSGGSGVVNFVAGCLFLPSGRLIVYIARYVRKHDVPTILGGRGRCPKKHLLREESVQVYRLGSSRFWVMLCACSSVQGAWCMVQVVCLFFGAWCMMQVVCLVFQ